MDYLILDRYRQLFNEHIEQAIEYIRNLKNEDFKAKVRFEQTNELNFLENIVFFVGNKFYF